ncbi:MAG: 4-hydroxybenzoate octaprenyltransferase [Sphingomonadaceae bacterium]
MKPTIVPDSESGSVLARLPARVRDLIQLARFDRPIGAWLLFWPGAWAVALAGQATQRWDLILWLALGSVAMRGAGCVYNDIVDRDLDARVTRTAARPVASGRVSLRLAWGWLAALCLVGLIVLLQLRPIAQIVALGSIALVAAYPFMKRITWWPQAWLGLVFTWAALVGWVEATGSADVTLLFLYAGSFFWVLGYDTIYALQDIEDDALAGVKSSARALGKHVRTGVILFYAAALACWIAALWSIRPQLIASVSLVPLGLHLAWQAFGLRSDKPEDALRRFRSNRFAGLLMFLACLVVGSTA